MRILLLSLRKLLKLAILGGLAVVVYRKIKAKKSAASSTETAKQNTFNKLYQIIKAYLSKTEDRLLSQKLPFHRTLIQPDEEIIIERDPYRFANFYAILSIFLLWMTLWFLLFEIFIISLTAYDIIENIVTGVLITLSIYSCIQLLIFLFFLYHSWIRGKEYLVITSKRVFFRHLDYQMSLPLDCICSVGTNSFYTLTVTAPSGAIRSKWILNYIQLHQQLIAMLISRQTPEKTTPAEISGNTKQAEPPASIEDPIPEPISEPEPEITPAASPKSEPEIPPVSESVPQQEPTPVPVEETDPFAPLPKSTSATQPGMRIGRCVMCRRVELPVRTVPVLIAGVERKRTLCEKCAQKHEIS